MRISIYSALIILASLNIVFSAAVNQGKYVVPIQNNVPAFLNNPKISAEEPVFTVSENDWLLVMDAKGEMLKVSDLKGNIGWIDKASVKQSRVAKSMSFEDATIFAYLDNPTPVYILDATNPFDKSIVFDRSFSKEIAENVDFETIERIVGKDRFR